MKKIFTFFAFLSVMLLFSTPAFAGGVAYSGTMPNYHGSSSAYRNLQSRSILWSTPSLQQNRTNRNYYSNNGYNNYPPRHVNGHYSPQPRRISSIPSSPSRGNKLHYENGRYVYDNNYHND